MSDLTHILEALDRGEPQAAAQLLPLVYDELRKVAAQKLAHEKPGQTLDATALVHEAYLRLVSNQPEVQEREHWNSRAHFFAAAAEAMRRILVDRARARLALKRGGNGQRVDLEWDHLQARYTDSELIDTNDLLDDLARVDAEAAKIARLHVYGGFSLEEAGTIRGISRATAYRNWAFARAWLRDAVSILRQAPPAPQHPVRRQE
jgi:RNA polymerase sigma factor (TIGR02999 family)